MNRKEMAAEIQDAFHYAIAAIPGGIYQGRPESGIETQFTHHRETNHVYVKRSYRKARKVFGNDLTMRNVKVSDAYGLACYIDVLARSIGIDANTGEEISL